MMPHEVSRPPPAPRDVCAPLISRLPPDVFFAIAAYLSTPCLLCSVSRTCALWHDLLLPCSGRRADTSVEAGSRRAGRAKGRCRGASRGFPAASVRRRLGAMSQQFWRARWQQAVQTDCLLLHHAQPTHRHVPQHHIPLLASVVKAESTSTDGGVIEDVTQPVDRLVRPFVGVLRRSHVPSVKALTASEADTVSRACALASLHLRLRPLVLTLPKSSPLCHLVGSMKARVTMQLIEHAEQRSITAVTGDDGLVRSAPTGEEVSTPAEERAARVLQSQAQAETALLCRKALLFLEQRADPAAEGGVTASCAPPSSLGGVVDHVDVFEAITFSAETYPPSKRHATEEELLTDVRRLCATTQYAFDCAYHQNFIAPHSLPCLRGEVGDTTTTETPNEPPVEDIDPHHQRVPPPPSRTAAAAEGGPSPREAVATAEGTATAATDAITATGNWVAVSGGSPVAPLLLTVNVLWTPQNKSELYTGVIEGFLDPPRGLGAFFPIALTPAAALMCKVRRDAVLARQEAQARQAAEALPIPEHFPTLPAADSGESPCVPPPLSSHCIGQVWLEAPVPLRRGEGESRAADVAEASSAPPHAAARPDSAPASSESPPPPQPRLSSPVHFLFPAEHVFTYLYLLEHITFSDVKHHTWEPDEHKYAVCSRLLSPTADAVECRFFYSYYVGAFPRLHMKMVFTVGDLPRTLVNDKCDSPQQPMPLRRRRQGDRAKRSGSAAPAHDHSTTSSSDDDDESAPPSSLVQTSSSSSSVSFSSAEDASTASTSDSTDSISFIEEETAAGPAPAALAEPRTSVSAAGTGLTAALRIREARLAGASPTHAVDAESAEVEVPRTLVVPSASTCAAPDKCSETRAWASGQDSNHGSCAYDDARESQEEEESLEEEDVLPRHDPDSFNDMTMLFVGGYGRVEVDIAPTISKEGFLALRAALGLPEDFPISWLWNVVVCATGLGARMMHRHLSGFLYQYRRTFTDAMESAFGGTACYGEMYPWLCGSGAPTDDGSPQASASAGAPGQVQGERAPSHRLESTSSGSSSDRSAEGNGVVVMADTTSSTTTTPDRLRGGLPLVDNVELLDFRNPAQRVSFFNSDDDDSEVGGVAHSFADRSPADDADMWSEVSGGEW